MGAGGTGAELGGLGLMGHFDPQKGAESGVVLCFVLVSLEPVAPPRAAVVWQLMHFNHFQLEKLETICH